MRVLLALIVSVLESLESNISKTNEYPLCAPSVEEMYFGTVRLHMRVQKHGSKT